MIIDARIQEIHRLVRIKRRLDLVILIIAAPLAIPIAVVVALTIRRKMGGPVIFRQRRLGRDQEEFEVLKFRTMNNQAGATDGKLSDQVRLTPLGRLLRKSSLDELPQLINILRGDMTLVGPRPLLPEYLPWYTDAEMTRHIVRPGVTGLAQVSGRNSLGWDDRLALDAAYVRDLSLITDLRIILKTFLKVFRGSDVSIVAGETGAPLNVERQFPRSDNLRLRQLARRDLPKRVEWLTHPSTKRYMQISDDLDLASTEAWFPRAIADAARVDFAAIDNKGEVVGMAGIKETRSGVGEYYLVVDPRSRGKGLGREVTELVLAWFAESSRFHELELTVDSDNEAALRIYEGLGWSRVKNVDSRIFMSYS